MKNQIAHIRHRVVLILTLASLAIEIVFPLASTNVAAAFKQSDSGSISSARVQENPLALNRWSSNGPEGATILSLVIDPSHPATIYAGTEGYGADYRPVFKSTNGGESWSKCSLATYSVQALAIDPRTTTTIYASVNGYDSLGRLQAGISKSTNGGTSWFTINNGLVDQAGRTPIVNTLAIDPNNPNIIYASGQFPNPDGPYESYRVYKTTDGGGSWGQTIALSASIVTVYTLAVDPINSNTIYAGGSGGNVFKSTNNGGSWSTFYVGPGGPTIGVLAIDPAHPNFIYAAGEGGVYKSTDGAQSWNVISDGLGTKTGGSALAIDPSNPSILYLGFYGGTTRGIFKSVNGGESWSPINSGMTAPYIRALVIDPVNTVIVYAGSYNSPSGDGIFKTTSRGASWSAANKGLGGIAVGPIAIDPANANNIYAGTYKSADNGRSWRPLRISPPNAGISALAIDPFNTATVYAGADSVYKSTNGGESWSDTRLRPDCLFGSYISTLAIDPRNSNLIYAGSCTGVFKSTNGGGTWSAIGDLESLRLLVIDPRSPNIVYSVAGFRDGCADDDFCSTVFKSTDSGVTWNRSDTGTNFVHVSALAIDPNNTAIVYAVSDGGIYKSSDGGGTWNAIVPNHSCDGDPICSVSSLAIDPINANNLYAGTYRGVYKSTDGGATWSPLNDGLTNLDIISLAIDRTGSFLHASTSSGVFDIQFAIPPLTNQIDDAQFFVRQHYLDFLNREPDADGLAFWINEITSCGSDQQCIEVKRVNTSAAFYLSIEFQESGYLVYRLYKSSFGNLPNSPVPIKLSEFLPDAQQIGRGVIVGQAGWETVLENNQQTFASQFVQRSRFASAFPTSLSPAQFVDALFANAGVVPSTIDRSAAINEFGAASTTAEVAARAQALRRVAENSTLAQQEFNRAFVLTEYFGYLRRNPNDTPDANFEGYDFWLNKLNQFNGDFVGAEMVKAFIVSGEYRRRFGP